MNDLPNSPIGVLRQVSISQTGIDVFSDGVIEAVQSGDLNPLELRAMVKALEIILERVNKATQENQITESLKYPGDRFSAFGVEFVKADVRTVYEYSGCNDPIYVQRLKIANEAQEQLKERETFLKAVKAPFKTVDESTGEVVTIMPPKVSRTQGLKVSIR